MEGERGGISWSLWNLSSIKVVRMTHFEWKLEGGWR